MRNLIRLALVLVVALAFGACRGRRTVVVSQETAAAPAASEAPAAPDGLTAGAPAADDSGAQKMADDVAMRKAIEADKVHYLVKQKHEAAKAHISKGEYQQAEKLLLAAHDLDPADHDVNWDLREVESLLGRRSADAETYAQRQAEVANVRIDEQRTKAAKLTNVGRMHMTQGNWDDAVESFEDALFIINSSPYKIEWGTLKKDAEDGLRQAKAARTQEARRNRQKSIEDSLSQMAATEEQRLMNQMERLEKMMGAAVAAFQREEYDQAEHLAEQVLLEQPDNTKAREIQLAASRASHDKIAREQLQREKRAFRQWLDDIQATRIPQQKILQWPSRSFWQKISSLRAKTRPTFGKTDSDPEAAALMAKVKGTTVNLNVTNQTFAEVVKTLRVQTSFNIIIDPRVASEISENPVASLQLSDVSLSQALDMLRPSGGDDVIWTTRGNIVEFTKKEYVKANLQVQIHNVADLTSGLTNFRPPQIQLVGPDDVQNEDNPLFGGEDEDPIYPYGQVDELIELIKGAVAPSFWENTEGADVRSQGEQTLVVKATPEIQEQVARFLDDLRGFAGIVVTVETRFLEISENFLRDVGVDWRGLGGQTPGKLVNLDDVTNGLEDSASLGRDNAGAGLPAAAALNPSAGAYFDQGRDGDFRARTENIFDNPLGNVLSSVGGATFSLAYLDDTQLSLIVRATEKSLSARTLTAPVITVYNTQRANLTVVNQLSYIQDFDVEVAQTSFIADPIVGIIQDGLTLDVRPTVSNDRRYITLELQPTVADLLEPIPTFATSLAAAFAPVIIQLPELKLQQARTTVRIPDQGSILIGGLKNISTVDRQSETPIFGKIPLLGFLFSRKGRSDEVNHVLILVRAQITDLRAQEEQLMGK
jgi:type II secretory pathway component GspD/PulD (secretin)